MTNVSAINGQRNLAKTGLKMGKTLEKLASGYRINRAADDAAGLAISEKMRAQINGNKQALRNSQDGISMLQTAEGAMDEVHSILQRMRELSVQAANGTYSDNGPERTSIGEEIVQLRTEIDRIAFSTEFNGQKVLTGALSSTTAGVAGTNFIQGETIGYANAGVTATHLVSGDALASGASRTVTFAAAPAGDYTFVNNGGLLEMRLGSATGTLVGTAAGFASGSTIAGGSAGTVTFSNGFSLGVTTDPGAYTWSSFLGDMAVGGNQNLSINGLTGTTMTATTARPQLYTFTSPAAGQLTLTGADGSSQTLNIASLVADETRTLDFNQLGIAITLQTGPAGRTAAQVITDLTGGTNNTLDIQGTGNTSTLQVGANVPDTLALQFVSMLSNNLGSAAYKLGGSSGLITTLGDQVVKTIQDSHNLMSALDGAIQTLNSRRGTLGAAQNRLEHTINSLGVAVENLTASESRIRDADIAELSSDLVASNILQSAGVSVLAQANQTPQAVLQLLQR
ncbi:MAG: flagellin [bacterium]